MTSTSNISQADSSVRMGPFGRAVAEAMDPELLAAFQQHLNMERHAHAAYFAAAIWFAERELRGFARYFRAESQSEHDHAAQFGEYLIARGQTEHTFINQNNKVIRPPETFNQAIDKYWQ